MTKPRISQGATLGLCLATAMSLAAPAMAEVVTPLEQLYPDKVGTEADLESIEAYCGDKDIKVAMADGWGGSAWRKTTRAEFEHEAAKCPNITEVRYTDAQANVEKALSDIGGLVAQGFDVIVVYPDAGEAVIRAMRRATSAGVAVVPYMVGTAFPGEPGRDYLMVTTESVEVKGRTKAEWIAERLDGEGKIVVLSGTPGNPTSAAEAVGWKEVWDQHPGIEVIAGPVDTYWDTARAQSAMSSLLAQFDEIDAIYTDGAAVGLGVIRAYQAADRKLPVLVTEDSNEGGCLYQDLQAAHPDFQYGTVSGRNWLSRLALRKAVAAVQGLEEPEPSVIELGMFEDSSNPDMQPQCDRSLPPDALLSSHLSKEELAELFK